MISAAHCCLSAAAACAAAAAACFQVLHDMLWVYADSSSDTWAAAAAGQLGECVQQSQGVGLLTGSETVNAGIGACGA